MPDDNSMTERLTQALDHWLTFTSSPTARLLVWRASEGEPAVIEAFVAQECDIEGAETDDVFLQLASPFQSSHLHGYALASELSRQHAELVAEDAAERGFQAPVRREHEDDVAFLVRFLLALLAHARGESTSHLALWLSPSGVADLDAYLLWLQRLVRVAPAELRFMAIDDPVRPTYDALIVAERERVLAQNCDFAMADAAAAPSVGQEGDPAALFRHLQQELATLLDAGELNRALPVAKAALDLAARHAWPQLGAAVQMALGATYASRGESLEAVRAYVEAERLAGECEAAEAASSGDARGAREEGACIGRKLRLAARLSQGAVLVAHRAFKHAAELYLQTVPLAQAEGDKRSELDCYRLASVCRAQLDEAILAWELGMRGLGCGATLDEETRRTSTLGFVFEHLVGLSEKYGQYGSHRRALEEQAVRLLGPNWRAELPSREAA